MAAQLEIMGPALHQGGTHLAFYFAACHFPTPVFWADPGRRTSLRATPASVPTGRVPSGAWLAFRAPLWTGSWGAGCARFTGYGCTGCSGNKGTQARGHFPSATQGCVCGRGTLPRLAQVLWGLAQPCEDSHVGNVLRRRGWSSSGLPPQLGRDPTQMVDNGTCPEDASEKRGQ